jgi:hypothetical protein
MCENKKEDGNVTDTDQNNENKDEIADISEGSPIHN